MIAWVVLKLAIWAHVHAILIFVSVPLRICNGRKLGNITCYTYNGQSCVDYCMDSPSLYNRIKTFCVGLIQPTLSDHCPIMATIDVKVDIQIYDDNYDFIQRPKNIP